MVRTFWPSAFPVVCPCLGAFTWRTLFNSRKKSPPKTVEKPDLYVLPSSLVPSSPKQAGSIRGRLCSYTRPFACCISRTHHVHTPGSRTLLSQLFSKRKMCKTHSPPPPSALSQPLTASSKGGVAERLVEPHHLAYAARLSTLRSLSQLPDKIWQTIRLVTG